jgi:protoporphyrinogen oxidase
MSNNWEFLTFPALSPIDKIRLAAGILYCQRINDPGPLERVKAADWLRRVFGKGNYAALWEPLLESKYGVLKDEMPATLMWATIRRYYSTRSKGGGKENLGFLSGGMKTFYDALTARVESQGGTIRYSTPAQSVAEAGPSRVAVETPEGTLEFDRLISTLPTSAFQRIAPGIGGIASESESRPKFLGVICMSLVLRRPLSPYYITNLIQKGFPFTGIIEVSNLCGPEELSGKHLVMLPRYDTPESEWFDKSPDRIAEEFLPHLKSFWPDIEDNLAGYFVNRERTVQAVWTENPPPATQKPGVNGLGTIWSANAELTGRDTLNNNAVVRAANLAAESIIPALTRGPSAAIVD